MGEIHAVEAKSPLTFAWLYNRVQDYVAATNGPVASKLERWAFWIAMSSAGAGVVVSAAWRGWLTANNALWVIILLLLTEAAGFATSLVMMLHRELPQFRKPRLVHAAEMDIDFGKWQDLVVELRQFPAVQRATRLRFIQRLRNNMDHRMGLAFGGTQRLGIFPILIALYLQFRNWKWGDWAAAFDVNLVGGLLIWAMLLFYALGWLLVGLRTRLDTYESLLEESLEDNAEAQGGASLHKVVAPSLEI